MKEVLLKDYRPECLLKVESRVPEGARFPVIDAHNCLFGDYPAEEILRVMDAVGVDMWVNVAGNVTMPLADDSYSIVRRDISVFMNNYVRRHPDRFAAMTMANFAQGGDPVLIKDDDFAKRCIDQLEADVSAGACGLTVPKELGLLFRDYKDAMLQIDDERLAPIWDRAGQLGVPLLIHVSDPIGFFLPIDERNEHYLTLREFPGRSLTKAHFGKWELLEQRNRMIGRHPNTTFILPHVANLPEDLSEVGKLLDTYPNVVIDFAARIDELGRQPYTAHDFFVRYQNRILFGLGMPSSPEAYRCCFRFLETRDEYFDAPDNIGRFGTYTRWKLYALDLPDAVLAKVYRGNALRLIPKLSSP